MRQLEQITSDNLVYGDDRRPALLLGSGSGSASTADMLRDAGVRLVDQLSVAEGLDRLRDQPALGLAWLELSADDGGQDLERLLDHLENRAATERTAVVAAVPGSADLVDLVAARLTHPGTEILVDADPPQRVAALAVVNSGILRTLDRTHDATKDNAARLRQLSDEMGRIASTLARLSTGPGSPAVKPAAGKAEGPEVDAETVRAVIRARRLRSRFFSEELFADPAWDMLLDLLQAEIAQLRVPVSSLCIAAAVPATTALRWIKTMTEQGLFVRRADPHDGRRVFVELAPAASRAMRRYFADVIKPAVI